MNIEDSHHPAEVVRWWGDEGSHRVTAMRADVRVGGAWRSDGVDNDGDAFFVHGTYRVVDSPRVLEWLDASLARTSR